MWSLTELIKAQHSSGTAPTQITEANGYYPSDVITCTPIRTVDGGYRQVVRILMPMSPLYFGSSTPAYEFAGNIVTP
jgi:hypothetical protein